jgi:hypothetical protein
VVAQPAVAQVFEDDRGLPVDATLATHLFLQPVNGKPEALRSFGVGLSESTDLSRNSSPVMVLSWKIPIVDLLQRGRGV